MKKGKRRDPIAALLFLCYAGLMAYLLFFRNRSIAEGLPYWEQVQRNYNLIPWHTVGNYYDVLTRQDYYIQKWGEESVYYDQARIALVNILGNVATFIPFGAFLPAMWAELQKIWKAMLVALATIFAVEIVQLLSLRGRCDIDDVLLNMMGIILGYGLWRLVKTCRNRRK